jgi:uncharacterized Fe-S center protein
MGVGVGYRERNPYTHSDSSYNHMCQSYKHEIDELKKQIAKNPDPSNFEILDVVENGGFVALKVKYPNCSNLEGIKIMVLQTSIIDLLKTKILDPHFSDTNSILARFEPTDRGWRWAKAFILSLENYD